jgi:hypothetical protein
MDIYVEIKNTWGKDLVYPACEISKKLCRLTGKKTFSREDIKIIMDLGYNIEIKNKKALFYFSQI